MVQVRIMGLKILTFLFLICGFVLVYGARQIVRHYNLDKNIKCDYNNEMKEEEIELYKINKAVINVKMIGMLIALPGLILLFIVFK